MCGSAVHLRCNCARNKLDASTIRHTSNSRQLLPITRSISGLKTSFWRQNYICLEKDTLRDILLILIQLS